MQRLLPALALALCLAACGPKTLQAKLIHAERQAGDVEKSLEKAEREMAEVNPSKAEDYLNDAKKGLLDPDIDYYPEHSMLRDRYKADAERLPAVFAEKERREREAKVLKVRQKLQEALTEFSTALEGLAKKDVSGSDVEKVRDAQEEVEDAIKDGRELEAQDARYASEAQAAQLSLDRASAKVRVASQTVEFVKGPVRLYEDARKEALAAREEKDPNDKLDQLVEARDAYTKCRDAAQELLSAASAIEKVAIQIDERTTTPRAVATACADGATSLEKSLVALRASLKAKAAPKPKPKVAAKPSKTVKVKAKPAPKKRR